MPTRIVAGDGSTKVAFPDGAGHVFEAAFFHIPDRERPYIACVSTQVGCAVRCAFCSTREAGLIRQLTSAEIVAQITAIAEIALEHGARDTQLEISFMGMGEPLANADAVLGAIRMAHAAYPRMSRVSVSTVGPADRISTFAWLAATSPIPIHLQISLHATRDAVRHTLIPGTRDSIEKLLASGETYMARNADRVCLNYVLLAGLNDSDADALWLSRVNRDAFYVKLTHLNAVSNLPSHVTSSSPERFDYFSATLRAAGVPYKIFRGDGLDINASCGQLAARPVALHRSADFARTA